MRTKIWKQENIKNAKICIKGEDFAIEISQIRKEVF